MSRPKRYFFNVIPQYSGGEVKIPKETIKDRCLSYLKIISDNQRVGEDGCEGGLYVGVAGVAYACYRVSRQPDFKEYHRDFLHSAQSYLKFALAFADSKMRSNMKPSFLLGGTGVYAVAAAIYDSLGKIQDRDVYLNRFAKIADACLPEKFFECGSDELFVGRAGYLCGLLFLQKAVRSPVLEKQKINALCDAIIQSGRHYSRRYNAPCPLMYAYYDIEYLGAAHGLSSILQILLCFPEYLGANPQSEAYVKDSVDFLLSLQTPDGNFPCAMDEIKHKRMQEEELVHWCHGAPGVVYLMAKAYLRWNEDKYLNSCKLSAELVWKKGLLKKGPGICHGIAGSGYVFLLLYRLTSDQAYLYRALQFANFLFTDEFKRVARTPDNPYSLYEGLAGTLCFLSDLLAPEKSSFPFFDIM